MTKFYRYFLSLAVCLMCLAGTPLTALAEALWPENTYIEAEGGILMDADSGAILYGKNIHESYFPASITKILTALIVIENCDLDEMVTFSHDAIFNVEENSSNMAASEGDVLSVQDCLYGLLLASANEAANALAEHVAGSQEAFVEMMNQKAAELGCQDSHFANPSGLNDPDHYTSAYDMALITQAAIENETFLEIDGALYWKHAPIKHYPDPEDPHNVVYAHHQMLKKNSSNYYSGAFAGKTGYTSLAGNTLVTCAERDGMTLIAVILNGYQVHYNDTRRLLDFGFDNFRTVNVSDYDTTFNSIENDMTISGLATSDISVLSLDQDCYVTLPKDAEIADAETSLNYELNGTGPENAIAQIQYSYDGRAIGSAFLTMKGIEAGQGSSVLAAIPRDNASSETFPVPETVSPEIAAAKAQDGAGLKNGAETALEAQPSALSQTNPQDPTDAAKAQPEASGFSLKLPAIPASVWMVLGGLLLAAALVTGLILFKLRIEKQEERERIRRRAKRQQRLSDIGCSQAEFDLILEERKRSSYTAARHRRRRRR